MVQRINNFEKSVLPTYQNLIMRGTSLPNANSVIKQQFGKGLRPEIANRYGRIIRSNVEQSAQAFVNRQGQRLQQSDAYFSDIKSKTGHRYIVTYEFDYVNPLTGNQESKTLSIGLRRLERTNNVLREIQFQFNEIEGKQNLYGIDQIGEINKDSVRVVSFVRTRVGR